MRAIRTALELGMRLGRHPERVIGEFDELDETSVGRDSTADEPVLLEARLVVRVELEAMPVTLAHHRFAVGVGHSGAGSQHCVVGAESHRAALVGHLTLIVHEIDHRMTGGRVELGGIRVGEAHDVSSELDGHRVQSETEPETGQTALAGVPGRLDLALEPAGAESTGNHQAIELRETILGEEPLDVLSLDPVDLHARAVVEARVLERLDDGQVGVGQLDVLADETDPNGGRRGLDRLDQPVPGSGVDIGGLHVEHVEDDVVETLVVEDERQLVDVPDVGGVHDSAVIHIAEIGDLPLEFAAEWRLAPADDHIGLDAAAPQLGHRVLRGLRLLLTRGTDERHQSDMHVADVAPARVLAELAEGL